MEVVVHAVLFVFLGIITGAVYSAFGILRRLSKSFILTFVLDVLTCLVGGLVFIYGIFTFENGNFAFFETLCFASGIVFELIFVQNIFASFYKVVYNQLKRMRRKKDDKSKVNKYN